MSSSTTQRLHALDGVRAVAATLVILSHFGATNGALKLAEHGHRLAGAILNGVTAGGVELFFTLSGVVLARPYLRSQRSLDVTTYFSRRAQRLFPPFLVAWLVSGLSVYLASSFPTWWIVQENMPPFQLQDWLEQLGILYWGDKLYNPPMWSLGTEVLFYLLVPLLILVFRRVAGNRALALPFLLVSILVSELAFAHPLIPLTEFNRLLEYSACFCGGMLLAAVDFTPRARGSLAFAGSAWVACSAYFPLLDPHVGWGLLAFALVSSASDHGTVIEKTLSRPLFVWLGERSYSLFLTHWAVIVLTYHAVSTFTTSKGAAYFLGTRILAIPLMLLAAMLLFTCVERRFAKNLVTADAFWPWSLSRSGANAYAGAA